MIPEGLRNTLGYEQQLKELFERQTTTVEEETAAVGGYNSMEVGVLFKDDKLNPVVEEQEEADEEEAVKQKGLLRSMKKEKLKKMH